MAEHYYAKPGPIAPIGLPGHNIAIWTPPNWSCFRILWFEGLSKSNDFVFDLGAIAAGAQSPRTALTALELSSSPVELAQVRSFVLDDIRIEYTRGQSDTRHKTLNRVARVDKFSRLADPCGHLTEVVILGNDEPQIQATNPGGIALAQSRLALYGFRFILEDLKVKFSSVAEVEARYRPVTFIAAGGL